MSFAVALALLNPTHYWMLDEASGNLADAGSGAATLTAAGLTYQQASLIPVDESGKSILFTPTTGYAQAAGPLFGAGALSYGCWFKYTSTGNQHRLMTQFAAGSDQWSLLCSASDSLVARIGAGFISAAGSYGDGQMHFAVVTRSAAGSWRLYADGALVAGPSTDTQAAPANAFTLGYTNTQGLAGNLDDAFILNGTELSAQQIQNLYLLGLTSDRYEIYKRDTLSGADELVAIVPSTILTHLLTGQPADSEGYYHVKAVSECGVRDVDAVPARLRRAAFDGDAELIPPTPNVPLNVTLTPYAGGGITLDFGYRATDQEIAPDHFNIYVATGATAFDYDTVDATEDYAGARYTVDLGTFADATTVRVEIRSATSGEDESASSAEATAVADATAPPAPASLTAELV